MRRLILHSLSVLLPTVILLWGCGENPQADHPKTETTKLYSAWDRVNNPDHLDNDHRESKRYQTTFTKLPLEGKLDKQPWSGDYWPTYLGGISYRWNKKSSSHRSKINYDFIPFNDLKKSPSKTTNMLSPAEKLDIFMGFENYHITNYERNRTNILKTDKKSTTYDPKFTIPTWEGLCHAWAPATLLFNKEPKPVTMTGPSGYQVSFGSSDIKALLIYYMHFVDSKTVFLGSRCNFDLDSIAKDYRAGKISKQEYMQRRKSCDDTNAGAFHLVLANQIGLQNQGFIADVTRDSEVWNQAIYEYTSKILHQRHSAGPKAAVGTVREIDLHTKMYYTTEIDHSFSKPKSQPRVYKSYYYTIELNKRGEIIGGSWRSYQSDRPDFLWKQEIPQIPNSDIWKNVLKIYAKSVS